MMDNGYWIASLFHITLNNQSIMIKKRRITSSFTEKTIRESTRDAGSGLNALWNEGLLDRNAHITIVWCFIHINRSVVVQRVEYPHDCVEKRMIVMVTRPQEAVDSAIVNSILFFRWVNRLCYLHVGTRIYHWVLYILEETGYEFFLWYIRNEDHIRFEFLQSRSLFYQAGASCSKLLHEYLNMYKITVYTTHRILSYV